MNIPFVSFEKRNAAVRKEVMQTFENFFDSKWYVLGNYTKAFELDYAKFNNINYCIGVSTGLDALHLCLKALDIKNGDEVIVPSNTYIATVLAITYTGATPVFVEPRLDTYNINPELIEEAITGKTKAIMPVHLYGQACEMDKIMSIANKHGLYVIEDNAQAHGAKFNGKLTGSFGHANATSFYPTKNLGALGEAGAVTTDDELIDRKIRILRNYGSEKRYYNDVVGYNNRIDEFEAAYLRIVLKYLDGWNESRSILASQYIEQLSEIPGIILPKVVDGATSVNHLFVIRTEVRDQLSSFLKNNGVGNIVHYPIPPHLQNCYLDLGYERGNFPVAEKIAKTCLSLPLYPGLTETEIGYVCHTIKLAIQKLL